MGRGGGRGGTGIEGRFPGWRDAVLFTSPFLVGALSGARSTLSEEDAFCDTETAVRRVGRGGGSAATVDSESDDSWKGFVRLSVEIRLELDELGLETRTGD